MIDREQFAADIYLRLLDTLPAKDPQWLKQEALRRADDFISSLDSQRKPKTRKQRVVETV